MKEVITNICALHQLRYISSASVSGGDINETFFVKTNEGDFLVKLNSSSRFPQMFEKEAEGLEALRQATLLKVPEVVATGVYSNYQYLVLEWLEKAVPSSNFWQTFAEGLAQLHGITNTSYGWTSSNYIGSLHQLNNDTSSWAGFYAMQRIMPLVKKLFDSGAFSKADIADAEKLCDKLPSIFPNEPPALVHGDLWGGNFMAVKDGKRILPSIYDPAVYYGHREMDIGMSLLFGGFKSQFYDAYNSCHRLEAGWQERVTLTQLYPLLVHAVLFGGGYINQCKTIISRWR